MQLEPDSENLDRPIHSGWLRQKHDLWITSYSSRVWCVLTGRGDLEMYREGKVQPFQTIRLHTAADLKSDASLKENELKVKYSIIANRLKDTSELKTVKDAMGNIRYVAEKRPEDFDAYHEETCKVTDAFGKEHTKSFRRAASIGGYDVGSAEHVPVLLWTSCLHPCLPFACS